MDFRYEENKYTRIALIALKWLYLAVEPLFHLIEEYYFSRK